MELYREADSDTKKAVMKLLKGDKDQKEEMLNTILGNAMEMLLNAKKWQDNPLNPLKIKRKISLVLRMIFWYYNGSSSGKERINYAAWRGLFYV